MKSGVAKTAMAAWSAALVATAAAALYPDRNEQFMPKPRSLAVDYSRMFPLTDGTRFAVACPKPAETAAGAKFVRDHAANWLGYRPNVAEASAEEAFASPEAYRLKVDERGVAIAAGGVAGVRHAISTLRQAIDPIPGVETFSGWQSPLLAVEDAPALAWRGIHVCWFPECTVQDIVRYLRLAAYYKYNYFVLESWGMFVSEKHPGLNWPESPMTKAEVRRLAGIAKDLGITLIPQYNIFGHASGSRRSGGKHAVIDLDRKYLPLFEPFGWNWCLSNPATKRVVTDVVLEMHEAFGSPSYFHLGCDEALDPTCSLCRATDYREPVHRPRARCAEGAGRAEYGLARHVFRQQRQGVVPEPGQARTRGGGEVHGHAAARPRHVRLPVREIRQRRVAERHDPAQEGVPGADVPVGSARGRLRAGQVRP